MAGSTSKRVIALRFDREAVRGYVAFPSCLGAAAVEVLSAEGNILALPYADVKYLAFVKTWEEAAGDENRKSFVSRPKAGGVWVRFDFRDGDSLEALLPGNLLEWPEHGYLGTPPDSSRNTQRVFVPKAALRGCPVLGVVGSSRRPAKKPHTDPGQLKMFD